MFPFLLYFFDAFFHEISLHQHLPTLARHGFHGLVQVVFFFRMDLIFLKIEPRSVVLERFVNLVPPNNAFYFTTVVQEAFVPHGKQPNPGFVAQDGQFSRHNLGIESNYGILPGILQVMPVGIKAAAAPAEKIGPVTCVQVFHSLNLARTKGGNDIVVMEAGRLHGY